MSSYLPVSELGDLVKAPKFLMKILYIAMMISVGRMAQSTESMRVERQIELSPSHAIMPQAITRAQNGDLIVYGANVTGSRAWATRMTQSGKVIWEFIQDGVDGWSAIRPHGQQFRGAVELPDQSTLLCGVKVVSNTALVNLVKISNDGAAVSEKVLPNIREGTVLSGVSCHKWGDGIALLGGVSGQPAGTGWMAKLDTSLNVQWKKFNDDYAPGDISYSVDYLYVLGWQGQDDFVVKLDSEGAVLAKHLLPAGKHYLVHADASESTARIASELAAPGTEITEISEFDANLHSPLYTLRLSNVGVNKSLALPDGSIALFGSQFSNSATAAVTRVYKNGGHKTFFVEPRYQSPWYIDAAFTGNGTEIAALRQIGPLRSVLDLLLFK